MLLALSWLILGLMMAPIIVPFVAYVKAKAMMECQLE